MNGKKVEKATINDRFIFSFQLANQSQWDIEQHWSNWYSMLQNVMMWWFLVQWGKQLLPWSVLSWFLWFSKLFLLISLEMHWVW